MYEFIEKTPTTSEYNSLREIAGWGALDDESVTTALANSVYSVVASDNDKTIAFARVIGDGVLCFYIQEIIVHPEHQGRGIATEFMNHIFSYLNKNASKRSYIGVFAGKNLEGFYEKYGFWKRPTSEMGHGMMQFWDDQKFNEQFNKKMEND